MIAAMVTGPPYHAVLLMNYNMFLLRND